MAAIFQGGSQFEGVPSKSPAEELTRGVISAMAVDQLIRQSITTCWMLLPKERRNSAELRVQILRVVERALSNMDQDFLLIEGSGEKKTEA